MKLSRTLLAPSLLLACSAVASVATTAAEPAGQAKIHPLLAQGEGDGPVEFLVILKDRADLGAARDIRGKTAKTAFVVDRLRRKALGTQRPLLESLEARGAEVRSLWIANAVWVRADRGTLLDVARRPEVERIDPNPRSAVAEPEANPTARGAGTIEWNVSQVGADQVWALGYDGTGITIGSQDTGFFWDHPALINSYRGWNGVSADHDYNWHDTVVSNDWASPTCQANATEPCDDGYIFPHGTWTMGIAVGDDGSTRQVGVAPGAKWIGCRNSDLLGGTPATYMECFQWLLAPTDLAGLNPDPARAPHVVNNSWACIPAEGCNYDTLETTIDAVRAAGIVVVAAAGNDGNACGTLNYPPAIYDSSFTVGGNDSVDVIAAISSRGPVTIDGSNRLKPDLVAPGIGVTSAVGIWDLYSGDVYWDYIAADGTSASAPHVTGAVALLLQARPDLIGDVDAVEHLLRSTAIPYTSGQPCGGLGPTDTPNHVYGYGRLDLVGLFLDDDDGDGTTNVHDCAIDDASAWTVAGPVDLRLSGSTNTVLEWTPPADPGATTVAYDVLRTTDPSDLPGATCVASATGDTSVEDAAMPGQVFYYAVQTVNPCGTDAGSASDGTPREGASCP
jgi:subtilisin family serine protease